MTDIKYLDKYNGVWEYRHTNSPRPWRLVAKSNKHYNKGLMLDTYYSHQAVRALEPFVNIGTNGDMGVFQFPPEFACGDSVWVDTDWLYNNAVDYMQDYIGSPDRIGGLVKQFSYGDYVTVTVDINVPAPMVTKK